MPLLARLSAALAGAALLVAPGTAHAALGTNVVRDGGGERITASPTEDDQRVPPDWTGTGRFSVRPYGAPGGFPSGAHGNAIGGGANFFEGGRAAESTGVQTISVAADAAAISSGAVRADLAAHLGGFSTDDDQATVTVSWLDGSGNPTGASLVVGPVTAGDRGNATELQRRSATAPVPSNAREARVVMRITRSDGANNDGYADNVSLVLTDTRPPPPPGGFDPTFAPINLGPPQVMGDVRVRRTVGCLSGLWTLEPTFTYAWTLAGARVPGATAQAFRVPANAKGKKLSCTVTGTADGKSTSATSGPVDILGKAGCLPIAGKPTCLRRGRRCKPSLRRIYRAAGFECRRRGKRRRLVRAGPAVRRRGAVVAYGANGRPSFAAALQAFERHLGDLPRVRRKRGVAASAPDGTAALSWMSLYRDRLTAAQKRVVDSFITPRGPRKAGTSPAVVGYRNLVPEATRRLATHGITLKRGVTVQSGPDDAKGDALATAYPTWLEGKGANCVITITPAGEKVFGNLAEAREIIAHELTHCAQAESVAGLAQWNSRPQWVTEGGATWAGGRIALEWGGTLGPIAKGWYEEWLHKSDVDLFKRDYAGVGWYQLLEHQGANVWPLLIQTQRWGSLYGANAAYFLGLNEATFAAVFWGPTLATSPPLGDAWDLRIPGYPISRAVREKTISNGTNFTDRADQRGGAAIQLRIRADVVTVLPGGAPVGRFKPPGEPDVPLREAEYCAKPGGCKCPDGDELEIPQIDRGDAYLGFHGLGPAAVAVVGESVESRCKEARSPVGINIYQLTNGIGPEPLVGTIKAGNCKRARDGFTARAKSTNGAYNLLIRIAGFEGFGRDYFFAYGEGDPWFRLDGPGGPYSNVFPVPGRPNGGAIVFNGKGTGFGFGFVPTFNRDRSAGVAIAGGMKCRYKGRRG